MLADVLHDENRKTSLKQKEYMTILRHALTGMQVCLYFLQRMKLELTFILRRPDLALLMSFLSLARNAVLRGYKHWPSECPDSLDSVEARTVTLSTKIHTLR